MKITYKGDYALKTILDLTLHYGNGVVAIHDLAKRLDIPVKFLEQILLDLKKGGFVASKRGKIGGYHLARPPAKIKLGEVVRFVDGPVEPIACASLEAAYKGCRDAHRCLFKDIWLKVSKAITDIIDDVTFEDLANKIKAKRGEIAYQI